MVKLQAEVDEVLGDREIQIGDVSKLHYTAGEQHCSPSNGLNSLCGT